MTIISVKGLKYRYPDTDNLVLKDITFSINQSEFIGIIGKNTSGKSTLCFALSGLIPHFFKGAYGGEVVIDGLNVRNSTINDISTKIGLVFDNPFSQMSGAKYTVFEEIAFGLENMGLEREEMISRVEESLHLLDIESIKDKNPFGLSGGQMQRVAIASVLAMKPDILILDEPTSQLDPQGTEEVYQVVENLTKLGITIILAEQKMDKIATYADRVLLLNEGELIDFDVPSKIFSRDDLEGFGIERPVVTEVAKALEIKDPKTNLYPITIDQLSTLLQKEKGETNG